MTTPDAIPEDVGVREKMVFIKMLPISWNISSYQIGRFPVTPKRGGKYIMVMADYESDTILEDLLTSRDETELLRTITKLYQNLIYSGLQKRLHIIEN